jgi:hypothetical protein
VILVGLPFFLFISFIFKVSVVRNVANFKNIAVEHTFEIARQRGVLEYDCLHRIKNAMFSGHTAQILPLDLLAS